MHTIFLLITSASRRYRIGVTTVAQGLALLGLALPGLAWPCLAWHCLALSGLALPGLVWPCLALSGLALPLRFRIRPTPKLADYRWNRLKMPA